MTVCLSGVYFGPTHRNVSHDNPMKASYLEVEVCGAGHGGEVNVLHFSLTLVKVNSSIIH